MVRAGAVATALAMALALAAGSAAAQEGGGSIFVNTGYGGLDGVDYDCADFAVQAAAQAYFEADGGSVANDADNLDPNGDGLACTRGDFLPPATDPESFGPDVR